MSAETDEIQLPRTNVLEVKPGKRAFYPTRWQGKATQKGFPKNWQKDKDIITAMNALHLLQLTRDEKLTRECLSVPIKFIYDSLPNMVKMDVNIIKTGKSMFDVFTCDGEDFSSIINGKFLVENANGADVPYPPLYLTLRRKPYHFWVVDVGGGQSTRWQLVILHLGRNKSAFENEDGQVEYDYAKEAFGNIESIAVIDPEHGKVGEGREVKTLDRFLQVLDAMGFKPGPDFSRRKPWIPPCTSSFPQASNPPQYRGKIDWSSGLRVFDILRASLNRITESYCYNPRVHDGRNLWKPHNGWFNPDAVRSDMIGMAATMVNRGMQYTTRVAIEPVKSIKFRNGRTVPIQNMMPDRSEVYAFQPRKRKSAKPPVRYSDDVDPENGSGVADAEHGYDSGTDGAVESDVDADVDMPEPPTPKAPKTQKPPKTPKSKGTPKTPKTPKAPKKAPAKKPTGKNVGTKKTVTKGKKKQETEEQDDLEESSDEGHTRGPFSVSNPSSPSFRDLLERHRTSYPDPIKSDPPSPLESDSEPDNESDEDYQEKVTKKGTKRGAKKGPKTPAKTPTKKASGPAEVTRRTRPLSDSDEEDEEDDESDLPWEAERKRRARILALSEAEMDTEEEEAEERWQLAMQTYNPHLSDDDDENVPDKKTGGKRKQGAKKDLSRPISPSSSSSSSSSSSAFSFSHFPAPTAASASLSSSTSSSSSSSSSSDDEQPAAKRRRA
ncbi:hypothetical protein F4809DRAFT_654822 [Biscogniauxia mediterranea]|nr:hypothetical protein F4809DRAFT_654822 [Biscogniauxia mediterranea]